ncbi:MAG TPA: hypothetical protein VM554_15340 [Acidisarcina sp.]|nr:hypothetical protein [Acidisarcina sp.]
MLGRLLPGVAALLLFPHALQSQTGSPAATLPAGFPLRIALDHRYPIRTGTQVEGRLTSALYLVDHIVLPVDTPVYGVVTGRHPVKRGLRINAMLDGDFTPLAEPEVQFDRLQLPDGSQLEFSATAVKRNAVVVHMSTAAPDNSPKGRVKTEWNVRRRDFLHQYASPGRGERLRQVVYRMMPYHPQNLWTGDQFDAELARPLAIPQPEDTAAALPLAELSGTKPPTGTIEARLTEDLTSAKSPVGMPVEAVLSKPLFDQKHEHLLLPEGTILTGSVVESHPAGMFGKNGQLRFSFRKIEMAENSIPTHGVVVGAEGAKGANIAIDSEGGTRATTPNRALGTLTLAVLAAASQGDDGGNLLNSAVVSNGFGMMGRFVSMALADKNVASGFAYYALAKNVYRRWIARGKDVSFPRNTRVEIDLAAR